jgi:hypothetical protein
LFSGDINTNADFSDFISTFAPEEAKMFKGCLFILT